MTMVKMDKHIKEILQEYGVKENIIQLIEDDYNQVLSDVVNELDEQYQEQMKENEESKSKQEEKTIRAIAAEHRLID